VQSIQVNLCGACYKAWIKALNKELEEMRA